jgi:tRNA dimethylallyltransferase
MPGKPVLVIVCGPTAVGKTDVSLRLAGLLGAAEIVSADSRQVYLGMDIGTAKPTQAEQALVPHHLLDRVTPDRVYSAGDFAAEARACCRQLWERGCLPILVGGSGLYLQAALDGLSHPAAAASATSRAQLQARLECQGLAALYDELGRVDPVTQARLEPGDTQRILRALERVCSRPGDAGAAAGPLVCTPVIVGLEMARDDLYARIDRRVNQMLANGLLDEVRRLLAAGYDAASPGSGSLGYREAMAALAGECTVASALQTMAQRSRQYAKRQLTWFRHDRRVRWLDIGLLGASRVADRIAAQVAAEQRWAGAGA